MLNRRILRIKAFKILYAYSQKGMRDNLDEALLELDNSCNATRDLYLFLLSSILVLSQEAKNRIELGFSKFNPSDEEKRPNLKLANNAIYPILEADIDFQKILARKNLSWDMYGSIISKIYDSIISKDYYKKYISKPSSSIEEDAQLFIKIFENEFVDNEELEKAIEELSIYWCDDLAYALTCCCQSLKDLAKTKRWSYPYLYTNSTQHIFFDKKDNGGKKISNDKSFVRKLLRESILSYEDYCAMIANSVNDWERERLFVTDMALIVMGLVEAKTFPDIPLKVSMNEYVEICKFFSTPKSRSFVNGILDVLIKKMIEEGLIKKSVF